MGLFGSTHLVWSNPWDWFGSIRLDWSGLVWFNPNLDRTTSIHPDCAGFDPLDWSLFGLVYFNSFISSTNDVLTHLRILCHTRAVLGGLLYLHKKLCPGSLVVTFVAILS